ncbi:MAG: glycosyltransferase family 2 protein [Candidatus Saccharimonadales bacterium]
MNKNLLVSIVIPVYNEEDTLAACLEAIAVQTVAPVEVIVVDNNSSDNTVAIAQRYPFVTVLHEQNQGVVYARNQGFNAARGDIIGRIDADTLLAPNWVANVQKVFADGKVSAASGAMRYHDMSFGSTANVIDLKIRRYLARQLDREVAMQGANMAVRNRTWRAVRSSLCNRSGLHEDFDIGIHILRSGGVLKFDESMVATIGYRQAASDLRDFAHYVLLSPRTYAQHGLTSQKYMYPVVYLAIACYLPLKFAHASYDPVQKKFSWRMLLAPAAKQRVNPATFVD